MTRAALAVGAIVFVALATLAFWWLQGIEWRALDYATSEAALKAVVWVVPALILAMVVGRTDVGGAWRAVGLAGTPWRGAMFGALATVPMAAALLLRSGRWPPLDVLVADVAIGPFAEEVLFRGFLFLVLRRLGWSFWSAAAASSILFGLAHIQVVWGALLGGASSGAARYELLTAPGQYLMRVAVIAAGGLLFAWIADRWQSLWPAIGLHAAINFWSDLVWGEARLANHLAPESLLWSVASCASLAIVIALTLRRRAAPALPIESGRLAPGPFERRWSD